MVPVILFLVAVSFALIDPLLREGWPDFYFRMGIPLMHRQTTLIATWFSLSRKQLCSLALPSSNRYTVLKRYEIEKGYYGLLFTHIPPPSLLRRPRHYSPLLHGTIKVDESGHLITLDLRLKLFALSVYLVLIGIGILISTFSWFGILWLILLCFIVVKMFYDELYVYQQLWEQIEKLDCIEE